MSYTFEIIQQKKLYNGRSEKYKRINHMFDN